MAAVTDSKNIIVLSDIHIGTNQDTNWYNDQYHAPYLISILKYVAEQAMAGQVQELIFLGDLFDQWMYAPDIRPPTVEEIVKANQNIFGYVAAESGPDVPFIGPFKACIKAVVEHGGKVSYVNGNHDMMVSWEEIAAIDPAINYVGNWLYTPAGCMNQFVCTHGHIFSMFCAPDQSQYPPNLSPLPLGHFVSRISALWCLQHGYKGWYTKNSGNPNGMIFDEKALAGIFEELLNGKDRLAEIAMSALLDAVGYGPDSHKSLPITLRDGSVIEAAAVGQIYDRLWEDYPASTGVQSSVFGDLAAEFAIIESDAYGDLGHFAWELTKTHTVIAMGHTHKPADDRENHFIEWSEDGLYVNSGFVCPAEENVEAGDKAPTFSVITVDQAHRQFSTSVYKSVKDETSGDYVVSLAEGPISIPFR